MEAVILRLLVLWCFSHRRFVTERAIKESTERERERERKRGVVGERASEVFGNRDRSPLICMALILLLLIIIILILIDAVNDNNDHNNNY